MQLVSGKTLKKLLPTNGFPLETFFDIAIPLADAVAAAHDEGITHRDLKPDNIMMSDDGQVKVLDFGLAKPAAPLRMAENENELPTEARTATGAIVGTVSYMSPEQAKGKLVDHRSDIFSLGIVMYELLTGRRPFDGDTPTAVLSSIIKDTPPPLHAIPRELARLVELCLKRDRQRRLQSAVDIRNHLESLREDLERSPEPVALPPSDARMRLAPIVVLFAGVIAGFLLRSATDGSNEPRVLLTNPVQLTSAAGVADHPAWSPDERTLAYAASPTGHNLDGDWDIWVKQVEGGPPLNRTADHDGDNRCPAWSPDGTQIAFWSDRDAGGYFVMPALTGAPRFVMRAPALSPSPPQWSNDGTEIAGIVKDEDGAFVEIVELTSGRSRRIELPAAESNHFDLSWSPDGAHFAFIGANDMGSDVSRLWVLNIEDTTSVPLTDVGSLDWSPSWSADGRTLHYISNRGGSMDWWRQPMLDAGIADGEPHRVSAGVGMRRAMLSPSANRLAYSRGGRVSNLWRAPLDGNRTLTWDDAEQLTFDRAFVETVDVSIDGRELLVTSNRAGNPDVWKLPAHGGDMQQLTTEPSPDWDPRWSPDGNDIVFYSNRSGSRDIWVMAASGGAQKQLTRDERQEQNPAWSPDGRSIVFSSDRDEGRWELWVIPAGGGEAERLTENDSDEFFPNWSPDGKRIVSWWDGPQPGTRLLAASGGEPIPLSGGPAVVANSKWSSDGTEILFNGLAGVWGLSVETSSRRKWIDLTGRPGWTENYIAPTTDGEYLYFIWSEDVGDIWVMDVVTDEGVS